MAGEPLKATCQRFPQTDLRIIAQFKPDYFYEPSSVIDALVSDQETAAAELGLSCSGCASLIMGFARRDLTRFVIVIQKPRPLI